MASRDINDLDQRLQVIAHNFLAHCRNAGLNVFLDCTYRSASEQDALYAQGRTAPGPIVTHAKGGESAHNYEKNGAPAARAFDIAIYDEDGVILDWNAQDMNWRMAHEIGRNLGLVLGADWPAPLTDDPHFEMANWKTA